jgi:hypothetical protein
MSVHPSVYRQLIRLYPRSFRDDFGNDMLQLFDDLVERDGTARAWTRTAADLLVTVPRYRLESAMNSADSTRAISVVVGTLAIAGIVSIPIGFYPGVILLFVAVGMAVSERGQLAQSLRPRDPDARRKNLRAAAILAAACVIGTTLMWMDVSGDGSWHGGKLVAYNLYFFATLLSAIGVLIAGLRSPRMPS